MRIFGAGILIFLFSFLNGFSQGSNIDSLINIAKQSSELDTTNFDKLFAWQEVMTKIKAGGNAYRIEEASLNLGKTYQDYGLYQDAINSYSEVFNYPSNTNSNSAVIFDIYKGIAQSYSKLSLPDSSRVYYEKIFPEYQYPEIVEFFNDLAEIYNENGAYDKSLFYYNKIESLLAENKADATELSKILNNIAFIYHRKNQFDKAIEYFDYALDIAPDMPNEDRFSILRNKAIAHFNLGESEKATDLLYGLLNNTMDDETNAQLLNLLGTVFLSQNDYVKAIEYYELAEEKSKNVQSPELKSDIFEGFANVYNEVHEYDLAFDYFKDFSRINDSIALQKRIVQKRILDKQQFIERKEKENRILKAQQDQQKLRIAKLEIEAKTQSLKTEALRSDSIQAANELAIAIKESEIAKAREENNRLELVRQRNLNKLKTQQLAIAKANEETANIEKLKQQREFELEREKNNLKEKDNELKLEQAANQAKAQEIERTKTRQKTTAIIAGLLALIVGLVLWAYRSKQKDNFRIVAAYDSLNEAQTELKAAQTRIKDLLSQQVSGDIAEALISSDPSAVHKRFVAVMFLDIRNFTVFCEGKKPSEIIAFQNSIFGFIIDIIEKNHGVVNQLLGDGFMATFGAIKSHGNDCYNAYKASFEIIQELKLRIESDDLIPTNIGIGIHAGNVVTGNVGSQQRMQFSITGNTVILAARLEQMNKQYGSTLIFSKELYDQLPEENQTDVAFESVAVKGRSKPIQIVVVK